jgi:class 3 adenylate cyclase/tetratricopeptide (TPR) repeat protein
MSDRTASAEADRGALMTGGGTVTVLFTDLVGSTELLARLGDDAAQDLRRIYFSLLREAAAVHEGEEVKSLGDGLMLVFHSAARALSCALAMQEAFAAYNAEHGEHPLGLRVGINVGEVIREEDDYFGMTVVVAKRLCDRAEGGQVLVSQLVRGLVGTRGGFGFCDLGALSLKGLADPVQACELGGAPRPTEGAPAAAAVEPTIPEARWPSAAEAPALPLPVPLRAERAGGFVGREEALAWLSERLEHARGGQRRLVLVAGEPGVGKTWLASELARRAHGEGTLVLYGRSDEETLVPFQPFVEALSHYVTHSPERELGARLEGIGAELTRLLPALRRRLPGLREPAAGDPAAGRYRLFEAIGTLLREVACRTPLILVLDDLHWADKASLLLLRHIARSSEEAPLLILGTYRDVELTPSHPLAEMIVGLRRERLVERLPLAGLRKAEVGSLIERWAGQAPEPELTRAIWRETEGHPFFVQEILRHLLETGAVSDRGGRLAPRRSLERIGIPEGVREVIESRLAHLEERAHHLLSVAAVIGREFEVDLLERVGELTGEALFALLEQAAGARLIGEAPGAPGSYAFSHALIRETLYAELSGPHRVRLHERIGEALEGLAPAERGLHLAELAHHYFEAATASDVLQKAIDYATQAGLRSTEQLAYEEAAAHYERAVRALALKGTDEPRRCELLLDLGDSRFNAGEFRLGRESFRQAADLAEQLGLADELGRAAVGFGGHVYFDVGVIDPVLNSLLERALTVLGEKDSALRARVMGRLAEALAISPQRERAADLAEQAVEMARRVGDKAVLAEVLVRTVWAWASPDNVDEQLATAREIIELAKEAGAMRTLSGGYGWQRGASFERGDVEAADRALEAFSWLAGQIREPYNLWIAAMFEAARAFLDKPLSELEPLVWRALEVGQATQNPSAVQLFCVQILYVRVFQGRAAEVRAGCEGFAAFSPQIPGVRCALAWVYGELGHDDNARREFERLAVNDFGDLPRDVFWLGCLELLADVCAHLGDQRRAARLYEVLAPYADHYVVISEWSVPRGSAQRALGVLAATMSRFEQAAAHFEAALEREAETGSPYALAKARCDYASMLLTRDQPGDRERAGELLAEALETAERLEYAGLVPRAQALRHELTGEPAPVPTRQRARLGERASLIASEAKAAVSTRGRTTIARLLGDASDAALERRFSSPIVQRVLFAALARSFQPRLAFSFEGEIAYELTHPARANGAGESDWWTISVKGGNAVARQRRAEAPALTLHLSVPVFVRLISGEDEPVAAILERRVSAEGDLVLGARLTEMFGAVSPSDVLSATG